MAIDAAGHLFWEAKHLATVHSHHGHHHVESEMAKNEAEHESNDHEIIKLTDPLSIHTIKNLTFDWADVSLQEKKAGFLIYSLPTTLLDLHFPPPKA